MIAVRGRRSRVPPACVTVTATGQFCLPKRLCGALPERDQRLIHDLPLTEDAISLLSNDQRALMTRVFRRMLIALKRDQRRQPVSMTRGGGSI